MKKEARDPKLKERWELLIDQLSQQFSDAEALEIEGVLYLIGLQEFGKIEQKFKKDDNVNLIHVGICSVLEPYGFYCFDFIDDDGWPHFELVESLPVLKPGEQSLLIKTAIVDYFLRRGDIS